MTGLKIDGKLCIEARPQVFFDRDPPYEVEWIPGDRMMNLLHDNGFRSITARAAGKGVNRTALHYACMSGDTDLVQCLMEETELQPKLVALVNARDTFGDTALLLSAILGF